MVAKTGSTGASGKMERDPYERVIEGASGINAVANLDKNAKNPLQSWEAKLNDGCDDPFAQTLPGLKALNGRNGPQAGA